MRTTHRTCFWKLLHFNTVRFWEGLPCVQNHVLKLRLVIIKMVCVYLEEGYQMWFVSAAHLSLRWEEVNEWEEIMRINKLTADNSHVSPFLGKKPKVFYSYAQKSIHLSLKRGTLNANMAAVDSLILPALELNERMLKTFCVLIGCNPVPPEMFYCVMIWKGKEQYLISRLQCECRYPECIYLKQTNKNTTFFWLEHITFACERS